MTFSAVTLKATGVIAVVCALVSAATIWLLLSDPVAVATAVNTGDMSPVFTLLAHALADAFQSMLRYL